MKNDREIPAYIYYLRQLGKVLGLLLIVYGAFTALQSEKTSATLSLLQGLEMIILGLLYLLPWQQWQALRWKRLYGLLIATTLIFAFTLVISVLHLFAEAGEKGPQPSLPMINALLLFFTLLQPIVILFESKPHYFE